MLTFFIIINLSRAAVELRHATAVNLNPIRRQSSRNAITCPQKTMLGKLANSTGYSVALYRNISMQNYAWNDKATGLALG